MITDNEHVCEALKQGEGVEKLTLMWFSKVHDSAGSIVFIVVFWL